MSDPENKKRKRSHESSSSQDEPSKRAKLDVDTTSRTEEETMDTSCDDSNLIYTKKSRKRIDRRPKSGIFIHIDNVDESIGKEICDQVDEDDFQNDNPGAVARIVPLELIRVLPSPEQIKKERKEYRRAYNKNPEIILKRKEKSKTPEEIEKRRKNNEDAETKERKKVCALARRKILADFKENNADLYEEKRKKYLPALPQKPRVKKEKKLKLVEEPTVSEPATPGIEVQ
jgi:hypothetical protein